MKNNRRIFFVSVFGFLIASSVWANVSNMPLELRKMIADTAGDFSEIKLVEKLPAQVVALCIYPGEKIANPGKKWQVTDVNRGESLPRRRLIWAVTNGTYFIVHYEKGGIAHSYYFLIAEYVKNEAFVRWRGVGGGDEKDLNTFLKDLDTGVIDDRPEYVFYH